MSPLICNNDKIKVQVYKKPRPVDSSLIGKILLFNDHSEWISHRLVKCNDQLFLKGDFGYATDPAEKQLVWGEIIQVESNGKFINPNKFNKIVLFFSEHQLKSNSLAYKRTLKRIIFLINKINRYSAKGARS